VRRIDFRELTYFLRVAECESIAEAALGLNMSASPLSRAIREFEARVGATLFDRTGREVRLNSMGQAITRDAKELMLAAKEFSKKIDIYTSGEGGEIRIGLLAGALYNGHIVKIIREVKQTHPHIKIIFDIMNEDDQLRALTDGHIDFCVLTDIKRCSGLGSFEVSTEQYVLMLPKSHPLSTVPKLTREHLAEAEWLITPERPPPSLRAKFLDACRTLGFEPRIAYVAGDMVSSLALVSEGLGICVAQQGLARFADDRITVRDVKILNMETQFYLCYKEGPLSSIKNNFLKHFEAKGYYAT